MPTNCEIVLEAVLDIILTRRLVKTITQVIAKSPNLKGSKILKSLPKNVSTLTVLFPPKNFSKKSKKSYEKLVSNLIIPST